MSDLVYQNYNNKCKGWVNPSSLFFGPQIISLTGYQSPAGSSTVISVVGTNFFSYSVVRFGTFTPTVYFINSTLLSFYVPNTLTSGNYDVSVCNGSICSNIVIFTIDMSSGYWMINAGGNTNTISNTNSNGVQLSWLSRGIPVTIDSTTYGAGNPYSIPNNVTWIICDVSSGNVNIILPQASNFAGREITFKAIGSTSNNVVNNNPIIQPIDTTVLTTIILDTSSYSWCTIVFNGYNWITMQTA